MDTIVSEKRLSQAFLAKDSSRIATESRKRYRRVSARNQLVGKIVSIRVEGIVAEVVLTTGDGYVTAIITANVVRELRLKKGDTATALIQWEVNQVAVKRAFSDKWLLRGGQEDAVPHSRNTNHYALWSATKSDCLSMLRRRISLAKCILVMMDSSDGHTRNLPHRLWVNI